MTSAVPRTRRTGSARDSAVDPDCRLAVGLADPGASRHESRSDSGAALRVTGSVLLDDLWNAESDVLGPLARGLEGQLEVKALKTLEVRNHFEEIARLRIPLGTEHTHEAL